MALERSLPLTRLPEAISQDRRAAVTRLDQLPLDSFSPAVVDRILPSLIDPMVEAVVTHSERWVGSSIRGGALERSIRSAVEEAVHQFTDAVARGRPELDRTRFHELGHKHARAGLPLSDLMALFTRGGLACWRTVLRLHRDGQLSDDLLEPSSEVVLAFAEEMCSAAVEGYTEALGTAGTAVRSQQVEFVRRLVDADPPDHATAQEQARSLGWELPDRLAVAVTSPAPASAAAPTWPSEALAAPHGAQWCVLLPARGGEVVEPTAPAGVLLAVGPEVAWDEALGSLEVAEDLLALAREGAVDGDADDVLRSSEHATEIVLARERFVAEDLVRAYLGPLVELPAHRRQPLVDTLDVWVRRPGQQTALAVELHVNVRTVRYRVDRLRELLGNVVDDHDRRLELGLAVRALRCRDAERVIVLDDPSSHDGGSS